MLNFIPKIGIMQGRLSEPINNQIQSFPQDTWKTEFKKAHQCGFQVLEWIFDDISNPLMKNSEIDEIVLLSKKHDISINSVCADYFMKKRLFDVSDSELAKNFSVLNDLIIQCGKIGVKIIEIPLVDSSSLQNKDNQNEFTQNLTTFLSKISSNIIINLETDLPPVEFKTLLEKFKDFHVCANYDTGNSASLGYLVDDEITLLEPWLKNIHIKDRLYKGQTVPLGTGDANFESFFLQLSKIHYRGDLIIQGARNLSDVSLSPMDVCTHYFEFVNQYVDKYLG
jgi:L-ribulose-5-phosphate 3-epimerase